MNVFITMLVGGGVLLSGIARLADKVASRTTTPAGEVALAAQLGPIRYPRGGSSSTTSPCWPRRSPASRTRSSAGCFTARGTAADMRYVLYPLLLGVLAAGVLVMRDWRADGVLLDVVSMVDL